MKTHASTRAGAPRAPSQSPRVALRPIAYCVMLALAEAASANPTNPTVVNGTVTFARPDARTLTVTNSPGSIINWQTFSIGPKELTHFQQQSATSSVLNRVGVGGEKSLIDGTLSSNGRVMLINPQGIMIGREGVIDTAGFIGSTLKMQDPDFIAGRLRFEGGSGALQNAGTIKASGDIFLVGTTVENSGVITSGGSVVLAAGRSVTITSPTLDGVQFTLQAPTDSALNLGSITANDAVGMFAGTLRHSGDVRAGSLELDSAGRVVLSAAKEALVDKGATIAANGRSGGAIAVESRGGVLVQDGTIEARGTSGGGGHIALKADVLFQSGGVRADGAAGGAVSMSARNLLSAGVVTADGSHGAGGKIDLSAGSSLIQTSAAKLSAEGASRGGEITVQAASRIFSSATLSAAGKGDASLGGSIKVLGDEIVLRAASLDASGGAGGGSVLVGGDYQGRNTAVPNARNTDVNFSTALNADARVSGDGGKVIVWSDSQTRFRGQASARGGAQRGDGGFIEVSGKENLLFGGLGNASARNGKAGTLLLDPKNIIIDSTAPAGMALIDLLDPNPGANELFAQSILVLPNGNIVATDSNDSFAAAAAGAVYLFDGANGALLSTLSGARPNDAVGAGGVMLLPIGGNYLVFSPFWNSATASQVGAATWRSGTGSPSAAVSSGNSLVGVSANDNVGQGFNLLSNGNYLIASPNWNNPITGATAAGAVTWAPSGSAITGEVSNANSLVGTHTNDRVGAGGILELTGNGNYVVPSRFWNGNAGAVTWASGAGPTGADVSAANSIIGSTPGDNVGFDVRLLGNGNYVVVAANWTNTATGAARAGAVTWGSGDGTVNGAISDTISRVGTQTDDQVGSGGFFLVGTNNYVFASPEWANGANAQAGAATFALGDRAITGPITNGNSLVGTQPGDHISSAGITVLQSGNYVVASPEWSNGPLPGAGAVTWGSGASGIAGDVADTNSLVGSFRNDQVGGGYAAIAPFPFRPGVVELFNGNYVVNSPHWNGDTGAVTLGSGTAATVGNVGAGNSLIGAAPGDQIGARGITPLPVNGNFVVASGLWNGQAGAVTWSRGTVGSQTIGIVDGTNSLIGTAFGEGVGDGGVYALPSGNYVVASPIWGNAVGAVTWGDGTLGVSGPITAANSLLGTLAGDQVGGDPVFNRAVTVLGNGNYVVRSPLWNNNTGAVTFGRGTLPLTGTVSSTNSLVGNTAGDQVGRLDVVQLFNSDYLVLSPDWSAGPAAAAAGAVTWGSGTLGVSGTVLPSTSLTGSSANDNVGAAGGASIVDLLNGNYLIHSPDWRNTVTGAARAGAVTFAVGGAPITGQISAANSLIGRTADDRVGEFGITRLPSGNYVVASPNWDNGAVADAGAVTWGSGASGVKGEITSANSLVGTRNADRVGFNGVRELGGNYIVFSGEWNTASATAAGAVTWAPGAGGISGVISSANSFIGATTGDRVGSTSEVFPMPSGNFVVNVPTYDRGFVDSGRVVMYVPGAGGVPFANPLAFGDNAGLDATITPSQITNITNGGTTVVLQANNDITLNAGADIVTSNAGNGGGLTMQAGRSIILNSSITTDNGALTLVANETSANNVVTANRDPGAAVIDIAAGITLDAGTSDVSITIANGATRSGPQAAAADITTGNGSSIRGGRVTVRNDGGGNIVLGSGSIQARRTGLLPGAAAIDIAAPAAAASISSNANMTTASGAVNILAGSFIDLDRNSIGSIINAVGNVNVMSTGGSISARGPTPGTAFMEITGAAITLDANTFIDLGAVTGHGLRARTGDVTLIAGTSIGGSTTGAMKGPIVADVGNVNISLLGLGPPATTFLDFGDSISAPNGNITVDNGAGGQVARSINLTGPGSVSAGGNITLRSNDFLNLGVGVSAAGTVTLDSSSAIFVRSGVAAGTLNVNAADATFSGGATAANGVYDVTGTTRITGGSLALSAASTGALHATGGSLSVVNGGTLDVTGASASTIGNNATLNSFGTTTFAGAVTNDGAINVNGAGVLVVDNGATLANNGTLAINGGTAVINAASTLSNSISGTVNVSAGAANTGITGAGTVQNSGLLRSLASGIRTLIGTVFNNAGTVDVQNGTLQLTGNGTDTGAYAVGGGAALEIAGGTRNLEAGASVTGAGSLVVSGGSFNVNAPMTIANPVELNGAAAVLGGSGDLTLSGPLAWSNGADVSGAGTLTTAGTTTVSGAGNGLAKNWINVGAVNMASGSTLELTGVARTLTNRGTFDLAPTGAAPIVVTSGSGAIRNEGVFNKSGAGTQSLPTAFDNALTGTLNVNAGTLAIPALDSNAGLIVLANGATLTTNGANSILNTGTIAGNGTVDVGVGHSVTNSGMVRPGASPGALSINGDYVQTPAGTLAIEVGGMTPGVDHDIVHVSGTANLAGTLAMDLVNGFRPNGETFDVMTYSQRVGDFTAIVVPPGTTSQASPLPAVYPVVLSGRTQLPNGQALNDSVIRPLTDQFLTLHDESLRLDVEPILRRTSICN